MQRFHAPSLLATLALLLFAPPLLADIGQIKTTSGSAWVLRGDDKLPASIGLPLFSSDVIETGADGSVGMTFVDNSRMSAGPKSRIELERFRFNPVTHEGESLTRVKRGTLSVVSGQLARQSPQAMTVHTPSSILAVRGTSFLVKVD